MLKQRMSGNKSCSGCARSTRRISSYQNNEKEAHFFEQSKAMSQVGSRCTRVSSSRTIAAIARTINWQIVIEPLLSAAKLDQAMAIVHFERRPTLKFAAKQNALNIAPLMFVLKQATVEHSSSPSAPSHVHQAY